VRAAAAAEVIVLYFIDGLFVEESVLECNRMMMMMMMVIL